jgi:hypothetical protein
MSAEACNTNLIARIRCSEDEQMRLESSTIDNERTTTGCSVLDLAGFLPLPQSPSIILDRLQVCSSILNGTLSLRNSGRTGVLSFKSNPSSIILLSALD